jgi:hypothetical protein
MKKKMIYEFFTPLAHSIQFTIMTFPFLRLCKVKIFPSAAIHAKNAILEGTLILQILFQGNG